MSGRISWNVSTPDGLVASGECEFLVVPTTEGELGVLPDHAALVSCVAPGEVRVSSGGGVQTVNVGSGIVDVRDNEVRLLVSSAVKPAP